MGALISQAVRGSGTDGRYGKGTGRGGKGKGTRYQDRPRNLSRGPVRNPVFRKSTRGEPYAGATPGAPPGTTRRRTRRAGHGSGFACPIVAHRCWLRTLFYSTPPYPADCGSAAQAVTRPIRQRCPPACIRRQAREDAAIHYGVALHRATRITGETARPRGDASFGGS